MKKYIYFRGSRIVLIKKLMFSEESANCEEEFLYSVLCDRFAIERMKNWKRKTPSARSIRRNSFFFRFVFTIWEHSVACSCVFTSFSFFRSSLQQGKREERKNVARVAGLTAEFSGDVKRRRKRGVVTVLCKRLVEKFTRTSWRVRVKALRV